MVLIMALLFVQAPWYVLAFTLLSAARNTDGLAS